MEIRVKAKKKKAAKPVKKVAKKAVAKKIGAKKKIAKKKRASKLEGEGSYTATHNYDRAQEKFIAKNRGKITKLAKDAEAALEGPEGKSLRAAERAARAKARR
jgi:hypothetical protein